MELRTLRYFAAVSDLLSFSKAAKILFVSQSNLSEQISLLEQELGVQLFERKKRGIELTAAGRELAVGAKQMLLYERTLTERVQAASAKDAASYRLVLHVEEPVMDNADVCQALIQALESLQKSYPGVFTDLRYAHMADDMIGSARPGPAVDLYLCTRRTPDWDARQRAEILSADHFVLAISATLLKSQFENASVAEILSRMPLLLMEHGSHGVIEISGLLDAMHIYPQIRFVSGSEPMELSIALGKGASIIPGKKAKKLAYAGVAAIPLDTPLADINLYAVSDQDNQNPMIPPFLETLKSLL